MVERRQQTLAECEAIFDVSGCRGKIAVNWACIGLDFSVMAPLPHALQRPDALGAGR